MGGSQRDNDSSPNFSVNDLKQKEIEIKEGSARVLWYETELPNVNNPMGVVQNYLNIRGVSPKTYLQTQPGR